MDTYYLELKVVDKFLKGFSDKLHPISFSVFILEALFGCSYAGSSKFLPSLPILLLFKFTFRDFLYFLFIFIYYKISTELI